MKETAMSTLCRKPRVSMPLRTKQPLSRASGRSVEVRMQTAEKGWPTEVKKDDSAGAEDGGRLHPLRFQFTSPILFLCMP